MLNERDLQRERIASDLNAELTEGAVLDTDAYLKAVLSRILFADDAVPNREIIAKLVDLFIPVEASMEEVELDGDGAYFNGCGCSKCKTEQELFVNNVPAHRITASNYCSYCGAALTKDVRKGYYLNTQRADFPEWHSLKPEETSMPDIDSDTDSPWLPDCETAGFKPEPKVCLNEVHGAGNTPPNVWTYCGRTFVEDIHPSMTDGKRAS